MERSSQEEKARMQVEFTAMYTNAPFLTKLIIPIKIDSAHAMPNTKSMQAIQKFTPRQVNR
jgi:hypothetical protein